MFKSKQNALISLIPVLLVMLLASLLAACAGRPVFIPIPVSSNGEPVVIVLATPAPSVATTPETATESTAEATAAEAATEAAAEAAAEEAAATDNSGEEAALSEADAAAVAAVVEDLAPSIPHKYYGREECTECHEAGEGKHASPADHEGYTDDLCLFCHTPREDDVELPALPEDASPEFCLPCHGPYEELQAGTEDMIEDLDGVKANPHMYVPHDSDKILACKNCHEVHELPVIAPDEIPQADADYCYNACHHEETFEPCTDCHEEGSGGGE
jgi:hypothetical protein